MATTSPARGRATLHNQIARLAECVRRALRTGDLEGALSFARLLRNKSETSRGQEWGALLVAETTALVSLLERGATGRAREALERACAASRLLG